MKVIYLEELRLLKGRQNMEKIKRSAVEEAKTLYNNVLGSYPSDFNEDFHTNLDKILNHLGLVSESKNFSKLFYGLTRDSNNIRTASGLLIRKNGKMFIYTNADEPSYRQRFTIAHEIGHYVLNHIPDNGDKNFIMRDEVSTKGNDPKEVAANKFAAELLMPEELIRKLHKEGRSPREIALGLKVSITAINNRLDNLKL